MWSPARDSVTGLSPVSPYSAITVLRPVDGSKARIWRVGQTLLSGLWLKLTSVEKKNRGPAGWPAGAVSSGIGVAVGATAEGGLLPSPASLSAERPKYQPAP